MKGDKGFAGAGGERQQDALLVRGNRGHDVVDGQLLVIARGLAAADIFIRDQVKRIGPVVARRTGKGFIPQFSRAGEPGNGALAAEHVDLVNFFTIGGKGAGQFQLFGIVLGLPNTFPHRTFVAFGFDDGHLAVLIDQDVIGDQRFAAPARLDLARGDVPLAQDFGTFDHAPAAGAQLWVDLFGSCFGFVHGFPICFSSNA